MDNKTPTPDRCKQCDKAINSINGRYCLLYKKNVHYANKPPCEIIPPPSP